MKDHQRLPGVSRGGAHALGVLILLVLIAPARAQVGELDRGTFVDGLRSQGMDELLEHWVETEPTEDPVLSRLVEIAQLRLRYTDPAVDRAEQTKALQQTIVLYRNLIADFYEHDQRPIWQTDLGEVLLVDLLQLSHQHAELFFEYGITSAEQRRAYASASVEALEALSDADTRFFQLEGTLPRHPDHQRLRVDTGLWARMMDEYWKKRTAFFLARAAYQVSLLPDEQPYFAELGSRRNPRIVQQADMPAEERPRLLLLAVQKLTPLADEFAEAEALRRAARTLLGRTRLALGEVDKGNATLESITATKQGDLYDLTAHIARAASLEKQGRGAVANDLLTSLQTHAMVEDNLLYRLLVTDTLFRIAVSRAVTAPIERQPQALAQAYSLYSQLLRDPKLGPAADGLRNYVYLRWTENVDPDQDLTDLPILVRLAIAQTARVQGQNDTIESEQTDDPVVRRRALQRLQTAIAVSGSLLDLELEQRTRAAAMYNHALANYWLDRDDPANLVAVAEQMMALADDMPTEPVAEEAITHAVTLLRQAMAMTPRPETADDAYQRATNVLFTKFPLSPTADDERLYCGYFIHQEAGEYGEAIRQYDKVPYDHPDYFEGQREKLACLAAIAREQQGPAAASARAQASDHAQKLRRDAEAAARRTDDDHRSQSAQSAAAWSRLTLSEIALADGKVDAALKELENFEDTYADNPELVRHALERRIITLVEGNRLDDASAEARRMMRAYPDDAAAVIDQVLVRLDDEIDSIRTRATNELASDRRQQLLDRAQSRAETASNLATILLEWAQQQGYDRERMLPFELILVRSLRLAGRADEAHDRMAPLVRQFDGDADVISEYAETLFLRGDRDSMVEAATYFDQLILGLQPPYPDLWWNAWMRRLQINDQLGEGTEQITVRVRALRFTDPNLGGPRFRRAFQELEARHSR